jgi:putative phosphoribosyl transferase
MLFKNRSAAGLLLAHAIRTRFSERTHPAFQNKELSQFLVLAIPRGGVVVAAAVATELSLPLDVWLARKIGAPSNPEYAIGSISINGELALDQTVIHAWGVSNAYLEQEIKKETEELQQQMILFRGSDTSIEVRGKHVLLVDDGVATGSTAFAALASLQRAGAATRILAAPVAPLETLPALKNAADDVVILHPADDFVSVGQFYSEFGQVTYEEVMKLLTVEANSEK